jgi:nucleoside-diphosphate kinase
MILTMQKTLVLFKSETLERGLLGMLLTRFENAGLRMANCRLLHPSRSLLSRHYSELQERNPGAFQRTVRYLAGKPIVACILTGPNAIVKARSLLGPTDPSAAPPGTIRGDFGSDSLVAADIENRATLNLVHAADSPQSAARELRMWFPNR